MATWLLVTADCVKTGGMDRANFALADYLARTEGKVHVVAHGLGESLRQHANLHWHRVPRPLGHDALGWSLLDHAGRRWARRLAGQGATVIVNGGNCLVAGACNWVHYVHAAYEPAPQGGNGRRAWQQWKRRRALGDERRALAGARLVIANSEATRQALVSRLQVPAARVRTIYYGTEAGLFAPITAAARAQARAELGWPADGWTALFVGALSDGRKGFDVLFGAWQRLCARPDWNGVLAVAGRGAEFGRWRQRAQASSLEARCRFLGFRSDVPRLLAGSDMLVSPTRYEAYGLAVHEAWCRNLPALVSAHAGVAERLGGELPELLLGDPEGAEALAERLLWCREHVAEIAPPLAALGERLRARSWDAMAAEIVCACTEARV